jgi:hypothetical protein
LELAADIQMATSRPLGEGMAQPSKIQTADAEPIAQEQSALFAALQTVIP